MKHIIEINDDSARYAYNVWTTFDYNDGTVSKDTQIFESDDRDEFLDFLKNIGQ